MKYEQMTLHELQKDLIRASKRGFTFPLAGALFMMAVAVLSFFMEIPTLKMFWLFGMGAIFP